MRILITGGNGSIAKAIQTVLLRSSNNHFIKSPSRDELDITNVAQVKEYLLEFCPNLLINCAGYINPNSIIDSKIDDFVEHFKVNLFAPYWCSKYALEANKEVIIINIGSTSAFEGRENWGAYCSSKAALMSLTETLAKEGVLCYSIDPAKTDTGMRSRLFPAEDKTQLMNPERVGDFVVKILNGEFQEGNHIILKKDHYYVLPMRSKV